MAKKIKHSDLFEGDLFKKEQDSAKAFLVILEDVKKALKGGLLKVQKEINSANTKTVKGVKELSRTEAIAAEKIKQLTIIKKQEIKLEAKLAVLRTGAAKDNKELTLSVQQQNKALKDQIKETSSLSSAYDKQSAKLNRLRKELKNVILTEGEGSKKTKRLAKEVQNLDNKLKKVDAAAGQFQRNVGNYPKLLGGATRALTGFLGAFGLTAGLAGFARLIGDTIEKNKQFGKSISSLSSITGATGKDLEFYKEQAREIGATTTLSSTQAVDAFKLIGSAKPELLKSSAALAAVTKQAVILAEAAELDLTVAATAVTTSLNQMGAGADQTSRFVNVLAAGSKEGAADIPFLNAAIEKSGAVARDANLSFEQLVAGIETIAPSVSEPSSAGLKFADILLRLQKSGKGFESGQFDLKDALTQVKAEFEAIEDPVKKAQEESLLFGKNSIVVGKALINNIDKFENFTTAVTGTNVALEQQATNVDNLDGDIKSFDSTIEAVQLKLTGSGGLFRALTQITTELIKLAFGIGKAEDELSDSEKTIRSTANNIINLGKFIVTATAAYVAFSAVIRAKAALQAAGILVTNASSLALKAQTLGTRIATTATKLFNRAIKLNPVGLFVAALTAAAVAFGLFGDEADDAAGNQKELNDEIERGKNLLEEVDVNTIAGAILTGADASKFALKDLRRALTEFEGQLEGLSESSIILIAKQGETAEEFANRRAEAHKNEGDQLKTLISAIKTSIELGEKENETTSNATKKIKESTKARGELRTELTDAEKKLEKLREELELQAFAGRINNDTLREYKELLKEVEDAAAELQRRLAEQTGGLKLISEEDLAAQNKAANDAFDKSLKDQEEKQKKLLADAKESARKTKEAARQAALDITDIIADGIKRAAQMKADAAQDDIDKSKSVQATLRELAAKGSEDAQNNLANEIKNEAALKNQKAKAEKEARVAELAAATIKSFVNSLEEGQSTGQAFGSASVALASLVSLIGSVSGSFYDGTENVADSLGAPQRTGRDGYTINVDGDERIFKPSHNKRLPKGMTNEDVVSLAESHNKGRLMDITKFSNNVPETSAIYSQNNYQSSAEILSKLNELNENTRKNRPAKEKFLFDDRTKLLMHEIKTQGRTERNHMKKTGLFG